MEDEYSVYCQLKYYDGSVWRKRWIRKMIFDSKTCFGTRPEKEKMITEDDFRYINLLWDTSQEGKMITEDDFRY